MWQFSGIENAVVEYIHINSPGHGVNGREHGSDGQHTSMSGRALNLKAAVVQLTFASDADFSGCHVSDDDADYPSICYVQQGLWMGEM